MGLHDGLAAIRRERNLHARVVNALLCATATIVLRGVVCKLKEIVHRSLSLIRSALKRHVFIRLSILAHSHFVAIKNLVGDAYNVFELVHIILTLQVELR